MFFSFVRFSNHFISYKPNHESFYRWISHLDLMLIDFFKEKTKIENNRKTRNRKKNINQNKQEKWKPKEKNESTKKNQNTKKKENQKHISAFHFFGKHSYASAWSTYVNSCTSLWSTTNFFSHDVFHARKKVKKKRQNQEKKEQNPKTQGKNQTHVQKKCSRGVRPARDMWRYWGTPRGGWSAPRARLLGRPWRGTR